MYEYLRSEERLKFSNTLKSTNSQSKIIKFHRMYKGVGNLEVANS